MNYVWIHARVHRIHTAVAMATFKLDNPAALRFDHELTPPGYTPLVTNVSLETEGPQMLTRTGPRGLITKWARAHISQWIADGDYTLLPWCTTARQSIDRKGMPIDIHPDGDLVMLTLGEIETCVKRGSWLDNQVIDWIMGLCTH